MKTHKNLYPYLCSMANLTLAWRKARQGKTLHPDIIEFEKDVERNLLALHQELSTRTYAPRSLTTFVVRDPKTRVIAKSDFRDRVVHHAVVNVIGPIFERMFIYDSCANQKGKGTLFALKRYHAFLKKVTHNGRRIKGKTNKNHVVGYCLKADIKHYFQEVNHEILMSIIRKRITDEDILTLVYKINTNFDTQRERERESTEKGMPLGNLTSQFFANVYLHELDYYVKHILKAKYYIRYVDDFVLIHRSRKQLETWKERINRFLSEQLKLTLHPNKSRIVSLSTGIDFIGFRNFYRYVLLRKRNIRGMGRKIQHYKDGRRDFSSLSESYQGWQAYACWGNTYKLRKKICYLMASALWDKTE